MSDLYKKTYRGYLIDHHSPDPPVVTLDKLDVDEYETFFKEANINNLMLYCKDHWGVAYYDTKAGKKHPGLKDDWIAKLKPVLKKLNIEFNAYYCLEYETYAPIAHPEWSTLKPDGTPLRLTGRIPKWGMPCYETGYRQYVLEQLKEIVSWYQPDSLFLDIFGKSLCYCPACRSKFENRYGYKLPESESGLKQHNNDVVEFLDHCAKDMLKDILDTVKGIDPEIRVTINFAALYSKEIRDMLDYQFTEPWAGNWLSAAYARDTAPDQYPQLGPGDVSEVYNYQPESVYVLAASQIVAQGCRVFMYSGSQHPDGTLEHEEAKRIGVAYREVEKFEEYLSDRQVIADIGIVQSDTAAKIGNDSSIVVNAIKRVKQGSRHRNAILGAMKLCDYSKYTWNVVPEQELTEERAAKYKVLLLPNVFYVSAELKKVLEGFIKAGGTLISSFETGLYDKDGNRKDNYELSSLFGCNYIETVEKYKSSAWGGYLDMVEDGVWKYTPKTYPPVSETRHKVSCSTGTSLAHFVDPATELAADKWVNWWCPPPSYGTGHPAVVENSFGKGKVVFTAFDMFTMENKGFNLVKGMFEGMLEKLTFSPIIKLETEYPDIVGFVSYERPAKNEILIHEVSRMAEIAEGDTPEIDGGTIVISKSLDVSSAEVVYPKYTKLDVVEDGRNKKVRLPGLTVHQIIRLRK